jgi:hypothetical protein
MLKRIIISLIFVSLLFSFAVPGADTSAAAASLGSTDLNHPQGKFIIEDNQFYYYLKDYRYNGGPIYRMKKNDPSTEKALLLHTVQGVTLVDGWLYFYKAGRSISAIGKKDVMSEPGFYKMKTDGTSITVVNKKVNAESFMIVDKFIYFMNDSGAIMRMTLNGTKMEPILKGVTISEMFISNGWLYYTSESKGKVTLNKIKIGSSKGQLLATAEVSRMSVVGDWIYYEDSSDYNSIYRIRTDGTKLTKLGTGDEMLVSDEGIYYTKNDKYYSGSYGAPSYLYRMNLDGSKEKRISMIESTIHFNKLGKIIFYHGLNATDAVRMMDIDGLSWKYMNGEPIQAYSATQMIEMDNKGIPYVIPESSTKLQRVEQSVTKARAILKEIITPTMTDAEQLKAVHDYIVLNTAYDYDNYKNDTVPEESYTEYGVLFKGIAVCDGYARATKLFLDLLGIENYYVVGQILDGELHAWNVVKIGDQYAQVDTTWDDPVPNRSGEVRYDYFMVNDSFMKKSREWYAGQAPAAN